MPERSFLPGRETADTRWLFLRQESFRVSQSRATVPGTTARKRTVRKTVMEQQQQQQQQQQGLLCTGTRGMREKKRGKREREREREREGKGRGVSGIYRSRTY